jgi:hypothetical protein
MGDGRIFLKSLRDASFKSNEPTFSRIYLRWTVPVNVVLYNILYRIGIFYNELSYKMCLIQIKQTKFNYSLFGRCLGKRIEQDHAQLLMVNWLEFSPEFPLLYLPEYLTIYSPCVVGRGLPMLVDGRAGKKPNPTISP